MRSPTLVFALAVSIALAGCVGPVGDRSPGGSPAPTVVRIAIQPTADPTTIQPAADELEAFLSQETGFDVELFVPLTYTGVIESLRFEHADAAFMSALPAALANKVAGAEIVLAERREVIIDEQTTVAPYYFSYYVVLNESPYQSLLDVRGKIVAYPSLTSTSGYLFPVAKLVESELIPASAAGAEANPELFFGDVLAGGGYGGAWQALKNGQADVGVIAGDVSAALFAEVLAATRVIETQGPVPSHAVVFASGFVGSPEAEALQTALLQLKDDRKELMRKLVSAIFVEFASTTTEQHVAGLRDALTRTGIKLAERIG